MLTAVLLVLLGSGAASSSLALLLEKILSLVVNICCITAAG
jgi:hypothetical protein